MSQIRVDYSNARAQARKLLTAASDAREVIQKLNSVAGKLSNSWEGNSATAFQQLIQRRIQETRQFVDRAESTSATILQVVTRLEETEKTLAAYVAGGVAGGESG